MSREEKANTRRMAADVVLLICAVFCVLLFSRIRNKNRQMDQIGAYTQELAGRTAQHVADVFQAKKEAVTDMAYLYGITLSSDQVDRERLRELEQNPGFDRIRYVNKKGESFTSDRKIADVSDRDYFIQGIAGNTGLTFVPDSRFDGDALVGFYAPVYFQGEICGVMVGFLEQDSMTELLASQFAGFTANTMLLSWDGRILGQAMELDAGEGTPTTVDQIVGHSADPQATWEALEQHREALVTLSGERGQSVACLAPLEGTGWSLMQAFPPEAAAASIAQINRDEQTTMGAFLMAALVFCLRIYVHMRRRNALERQRADADRVAELLGSVADDYLCLIDVNLLTGQEEQFRLRGGEALPDWSGGSRDYKTCAEGYISDVVSAKDRPLFRQTTDLEKLKEVLAAQKDFYLEYDAMIGGGKRRLQSKFTLCTDQFPEPRMLIGVRDITTVTEDLRRAKEAAESASRAKSTFLFNMSHDIRTPMNAIMGFSDMARRHMDDPEKVRDCLDKINLSGEQLLRLINNVLDMARIESGRVELKEQTHRISDTMKAMECLFQAEGEKKKLDLRFFTQVREDVAVFDELRVNQIQLNLISNAIKYTPTGGSVTVTLEQTGSEAGVLSYRFTVEDTGIGMSQEFLKNAFEVFERDREAVSSGIEGTGLGLSITKRLAEQMGGSISCTSRQGEGSRFVCELRFRRGHVRDLPENRPKPQAPARKQKGSILLVEDNALNREISRELLQNDGFQVTEAEDGDVALEKVRTSSPGTFDLILMDVQMPRMDGYEATRRIRALSDRALANIPIIALTANAFEEDRQAARQAGMNGHVAKPIDGNALRETIDRYL